MGNYTSLSPEAKELAEIWARALLLYPTAKSGNERGAWVKQQVFGKNSCSNSSHNGNSGASLALRKRWCEKANLSSFKRSGVVMLVKYKERIPFRQYRDLVLSKLLMKSQRSDTSEEQDQREPNDDNDEDAKHAEMQQELAKEQTLGNISTCSCTNVSDSKKNDLPPSEAKVETRDIKGEEPYQITDSRADSAPVNDQSVITGCSTQRKTDAMAGSSPKIHTCTKEQQQHQQPKNQDPNSHVSLSTPSSLKNHFPTPPAELSTSAREFAIYWAKSFTRFPKIRAHNKRREAFVKNLILENGSMALKKRWVTQSRMPSFARAGLGSVISSKERDAFRIYRDAVRDHLQDHGYNMDKDDTVDDFECDSCDDGAKNIPENPLDGYSCKSNDIPSPPEDVNLSLEAKQIAIFWAKAMIEFPDSTMTKERVELIRRMVYSEGSTKLRQKWASRPTCTLLKSGVASLLSYKERDSCRKYRNLVVCHWSNQRGDADVCKSTELSETMKHLASFWAKTLYACPEGTEDGRESLLRDLIFGEGSIELQDLWKTKSVLPRVRKNRNIVYNLVPAQDWSRFRSYRDDVLEELISLKLVHETKHSHYETPCPIENIIKVAKAVEEVHDNTSTTSTDAFKILKTLVEEAKVEKSIMSIDDARQVEVIGDNDCLTRMSTAAVGTGLKNDESRLSMDKTPNLEVKIPVDCVSTFTKAPAVATGLRTTVELAKINERKMLLKDARQVEVNSDGDCVTTSTETAAGAFSKNTVGAKIQGFLATAGYLVPSVHGFSPKHGYQNKTTKAGRGSGKRSTKRAWLDKQSSASIA